MFFSPFMELFFFSDRRSSTINYNIGIFTVQESTCNYCQKTGENHPKMGREPHEETLTLFCEIYRKQFFAIRNESRPNMHVQYSEVRLYYVLV